MHWFRFRYIELGKYSIDVSWLADGNHVRLMISNNFETEEAFHFTFVDYFDMTREFMNNRIAGID